MTLAPTALSAQQQSEAAALVSSGNVPGGGGSDSNPGGGGSSGGSSSDGEGGGGSYGSSSGDSSGGGFDIGVGFSGGGGALAASVSASFSTNILNDIVGAILAIFGLPVVLDLTGNGINITPLSQSNTYEDTTGSGYKSQTAWAGAGNGVLFFDASGQGVLTEANQFIFSRWDPSASSDLQALADVFDTNHDGKLDAADAQFANFFVMVTNADGTMTARSLASLGIASINLGANADVVTLSDGSSITGESTYTTTSGVTRLVANASLAASSAAYAVTETTTHNADGSTTIANAARNADGSAAHTTLLNTSADGQTRVLSDVAAGGVVTTLQTDATTTASNGTTTETLVNYRGGQVNAAGEVTSTGEKLNETVTTSTHTAGISNTVYYQRDQTGSGSWSEVELDTTNPDGSIQVAINEVTPDQTTYLLTTASITNYAANRTTTTEVDGNAAWETSTIEATTIGAPGANGLAPQVTSTVTKTAGTTTVSKNVTVSTTAANGVVTEVTSSDQTDGSTLNLTTTATSATTSSGSTLTTVETNADGSLRSVTVATVDPTGLLKSSKTDSTGLGSAAAPAFDRNSTDNTVDNSDGSITETVTDTAANGQLRDKTVTHRFADGVSRTVTVDSTGDGLTDRTETITTANGVVTDTIANLTPGGALANETVNVTGASGLTKTTSVDTTGAVTSGGAPIFDLVTTDAMTHNADGSSTEVLTDSNSDGTTRDQTTTLTSANGLTITTSKDVTGTAGVADGTADRVTTDTTVINGDGSLTETINTLDQYGNQLSATTKTTTANRLQVISSSTLGTTGLEKTVETVTKQAGGLVYDLTASYDSQGDVLGAKMTSASADGLSKSTSIDVTGQAAGAAITYDQVTNDQIAINNDGSRTETITTTSKNGSLIANQVITRSANGLSTTTSTDQFGRGSFDTVTTDVSVINTNGSRTETVTDFNNSGSKRDQTVMTTSATGLSKTMTQDFNGDGTVDLTTTDVTTINADGSDTEVVTHSNASGMRDQTTTTSGVVNAYGNVATIAQQSNGSVPTYSVETIATAADGSATDIVQNYATAGGTELSGTLSKTSANGLVKTKSVDVNGDGTYDITTIDETTLNTNGSTTETLTTSNATGLIHESVRITSANGLSITTEIDDNGATSGGSPVFDQTVTDNTVLNVDGSATETVSTAGSSGTIYEKVVSATSADQQTKTIKRYLNETGSIGTVDQLETIQTQTNGSVVDAIQSYGPGNALIGTITKTKSGNGLVVATTYANPAGQVTDTQTVTKTLNANGSGTTVFSDVSTGAGTSTVTTNTSANGLVVTRTASLSSSAGTASFSTTDITTIASTGVSTEVVADMIGSATAPNDTTTKTVSANGRVTTVSTDENGDGAADITDQIVVALDGSQTETLNYYTPGADALARSSIVTTSVDGRTVTTTHQSDYDGAKFNVMTDVSVSNANGTTTDTITASGSFGALADSQTVTSALNVDGSRTTSSVTSDPVGIVFGQTVATVSASGLVRSSAADTTGLESLANLQASASNLINGASLPATLLTTDILGLETTTTNADGSTTVIDKTEFGSGLLRSNTNTVQSANGLVTTTSIDNDGNGFYEQVDTLTVATDGSKTDLFNYYGDTQATANTLVGSNTLTTSANGLDATLTTSNGIVDTTIGFADANGSYQWSRAVVPGSVAATSSSILNNVNGSSTHTIDANGMDTWSWNDGSGHTGAITIDTATENQNIAIANEIYLTITGQPMDDASTQYLAEYITNGVLNRAALATALVNSPAYANSAGLGTTAFGSAHPGYQVSAVVSAFENALGRSPTAQEMTTYYQLLPTTPSAAGIAALAVAVAQYASDLGAANNRTQLDQNQDLVSTSADWSNPALASTQIQTAGTYALSNSLILDQSTSTGTGVAATITGINNIILASNGSNVAISGANNYVDDLSSASATISASNTDVLVESGGTAAINGINDDIAQISGSTATITGTNNFIEASSATINLGINSQAIIESTGGDTITAQNGDTVSVGGNGNAGTGDTLSISSGTVTLRSNSKLDVTGTGNTISVGANSTIGLHGNNQAVTGASGDTINDVSGTGDIINVSNAAVSFAQNLSGTVNGGGDTISGQAGDTISVGGNASTGLYDTLNMASGTVNLLANSLLKLNGNSNTITTGAGSTVNVSGNNETINAANNSFVVDQSGSGDTINASNVVLTFGAGVSASITGASDTISGQTGDVLAVIGSSGASFTFNGTGTTTNLAQNLQAVVAGSGNTFNATNDTLSFNGGISGSVNGGGDTINGQSGDNLTLSGASGSTYTVNASETTLAIGSHVSASITGSGDIVTSQSSSSVTIGGNGASGENNILTTSGGSVVLLANSRLDVFGDQIYISSGSSSTLGIHGNSEIVYAGNGDAIYVDAGGGSSINASYSNVTMASGLNATVIGNFDPIHTGSGVVTGITGNNNALWTNSSIVNVNSGSLNLDIIGDWNTAYAASGTWFDFTGVQDVGFISNGRADLESGASSDTIIGNWNTVNAASGDMFGITGQNDTVNAGNSTIYLNSNTYGITINGNSNSINASSGDSLRLAGQNDVVHANQASIYLNDNLSLNFIYADNSVIYEGNNDLVDIIGSGDTVYMGSGDTNLGVGSGNGSGGGQDFRGAAASIPSLGDNLNVVAQYAVSVGDMSAAETAQNAALQASVVSQVAADFGPILTPEFEGAAWTNPSTQVGQAQSNTVITWSFASNAGDASDPFSSYIDSQYQATIQQALQAWSAVSGITFEQTSDTTSTDIRIGWGDFNTTSSGVLGYTSFQQDKGAIQAGTIIRLEDPSELNLTTNSNGDLAYVGAGATLYQVALHEIGRALGLTDNADPNSVMFPSSSDSNQTLDQTDISGVQTLYGTPNNPINAASVIPSLQQIYVNTSQDQSASTDQLGLNQLIQAIATFSPQQSSTSLPAIAAQNNSQQQQIAAPTVH